MTPPRSSARAAVLAVTAVLLVSCGGGGGPVLPETPSRTVGPLPTLSATRPDTPSAESPPEEAEPPATSRAASDPEPSADARTEEQTGPGDTEPGAGTATPVPGPTASRPALALPTLPPASAPPADTRPAATSAPPAAPAPSTTTPPATAAEPDPATEETPASAWWWLLGAAGVAGVAVLLRLRARRRATWRSGLEAAEDDVAWLARAFVPELGRATTPDQAAGSWIVGSDRMSDLEDRLTTLEATAPDDAGRTRAHELRNAVRNARGRLAAVVSSWTPGTAQRDLAVVAAELATAVDTSIDASR